jgi:DNA-binding IclR family transcriptional regulator
MMENVPVKSVKKALDLLNLLVLEDPGREGLALRDLARRLKFPTATAHNLLKTLCACGYAAQTGVGCYTVGPRCLEIGRFNHLLTETTASALRAQIEALGRKLNETVTFAVLADGRRLRLWSSVPGHLVRIDPDALETRKLFSVPTGRILAAYAAPDDLERLLERYGLPTGSDWQQATTRAALNRALAEIRACGHEIIIRGELTAFAVPVLDTAGGLAGSLGCFSPTFRCPSSQHAAIVAALVQTAREMAAVF